MLPESLTFSPVQKRQIIAEFSGGHITSDAGLLLLREIDRKAGLTRKLSSVLPDHRQSAKVQHSLEDVVRQRVYGLACGYEDLNDHDHLRRDITFQTALNRVVPLASKATLGRMEQKIDRQAVVAAHQVLWEHFVAAHKRPPKQIVLDFDATDIQLHGGQEGRFFNGYYDHYCYLPLYVFCGRHLLVSYLRPSNVDGARHSWAILSLLVKFIRCHWPQTQIILRADSGFCRHRMLSWCERKNVDYVVGLARNSRLQAQTEEGFRVGRELYQLTRQKVSFCMPMLYRAKSWHRRRYVVAKVELGEKGENPRFIVSTLYQENAKELYRGIYCARGDMENRIKDQQLDLFADRTSSPSWWTNQWRLLLSGFAYTLFEELRRHLAGTELATASVNSLRLKLLKLGAVVIRNTRRIRFLLSEAYPYQDLFSVIYRRLVGT